MHNFTVRTRLFAIRHTSIHNAEHICYGRFNIQLTESFELESAIILSKLQNSISHFKSSSEECSSTPIKILSSPSERCIRLAEYLSGELNIFHELDHRLLEYDFGSWEGIPWNQISPQELNPWMEDFVNVCPPNGETLVQFRERVENLVIELRTKKPGILILVTHAGVIRLLNSLILGYPLENMFRFEVRYGNIYEYEIGSIDGISIDRAF